MSERRLLLALDHARNREVLTHWLEQEETLAPAGEDDGDFDLVVLDGPALVRRRQWLRQLRAAAAPVYLPALLTTPHREVSLLTAGLWRDVDELITTPIRGDELRVRVERLLELRRRSQETARRVEELDRSNTDLQQFAFVAAHELSTPLTVVTGVIETVNARYGDELRPDVAELLAAARTSSHRLRLLIDDLLVYSQAGHGVELGPVELSAVVAGALEEMAATLERSGARIEVERLPRVLGDARQLRLVFTNLVGNAVKYARPGEPPVVRIGAEPDGDGWCVTVADNGIGIEPRRAEALFAMFERERPDGDRPGSGIGLALCRRIMERHDGAIWIEPGSDGGTCVKLRLHAADPAASR